MRFLLFIITCLGIVLMAQSCKKECQDKSNPDCENYDPCYGKAKTSADFTISEVVGGRAFETDEVWRNSYVQFTAKQDFESYQWVIGTHKDTFYTKSCGLSGFPEGQSFQVRLIGKKKPNTDCFPTDDGIDTVYKTFKVTAHDSLRPIYGEYEGYFSNYPDHKVIVKVGRDMIPDFPTWKTKSYFTNIPAEGCWVDDITPASTAWSVNGMSDGPFSGGYRMIGYVYLLPDKKTLKAEYTHWDTATRYPNFVRINGSFTGTRK